jgi:hypothetical protein
MAEKWQMPFYRRENFPHAAAPIEAIVANR